jgi:hypothetical protein
LFGGVPAVLAVPRADAVKVIDLSVVNFSEQAFVDDRLDGDELAENRHSKQTHVFTPARCTAFWTAWQSSHDRASGFSMMRCLPAFAAAMACSAC